MHFPLQTLGIAGNAARWLDFPPSVINDPERRVPAAGVSLRRSAGVTPGAVSGVELGSSSGGWQILCGNSEICKVISVFVFVI